MTDFEWDAPPSREVGSMALAFPDEARRLVCRGLAEKVQAMEALVLQCLREEHDHESDKPCLRCMAQECVSSWTGTIMQVL